MKWAAMSVALLMLGMMMLGGVTGSAHAGQLTDSEKQKIMDAVKGHLKDPDSAEFKWIEMPTGTPQTYCGYVNAKNAYGGYAGNTPYQVFLGWIDGKLLAAAFLGIGGSDTETAAVVKVCADHGYNLN